MLSKRIIACLDVRNGQVVKGVNFEGLRSAGNPAELARRYNREGIDELVILDITATIEQRRALADTIRAVARELFIRSRSAAASGRRPTRRQPSKPAPTGQPEHRRAVQSVAHHDARALRQPGRHRRD
jgi:hypothetical protein